MPGMNRRSFLGGLGEKGLADLTSERASQRL